MGPLGRDIGYPYGTGGWAGCGQDGAGRVLQGGYRDQLIFSVLDGNCRAINVTTYPAPLSAGQGVTGCLARNPQIDPYKALGRSAPTYAGSAAPTKGVFGPDYNR